MVEGYFVLRRSATHARAALGGDSGPRIERGAGSLNTTSHERGTDLELRPLSGGLGAEITGFDFEAPISDERFAAVHAAFLEWQVLVFSGNEVPPGRQVEFARRFGEVQVHVMNQYHTDGYPELYRLSNLDADGNPSGRHPGPRDARVAHGRFVAGPDRARDDDVRDGDPWPRAARPTSATCTAPSTASRAETRERIEELRAVHNLDFSRSRRHGEEPMTRGAAPEGAAGRPPGRPHPPRDGPRLPVPRRSRGNDRGDGLFARTGRALVDELNETAATPRDGLPAPLAPARQLVVWDNRCLMHRATAYDTATERRVIRRCTVLGDAPFRRRSRS